MTWPDEDLCQPTPDMQQYIDELNERFPNPADRFAFVESQVEGASDFTRGFVDPNEPDNSEW